MYRSNTETRKNTNARRPGRVQKGHHRVAETRGPPSQDPGDHNATPTGHNRHPNPRIAIIRYMKESLDQQQAPCRGVQCKTNHAKQKCETEPRETKVKRVHPSQSPLMCAFSIFSHDGPPSVPTTCMLLVVQFTGGIRKRSLRDGYEMMLVDFIKQSVSSKGAHSLIASLHDLHDLHIASCCSTAVWYIDV